MNENNDSAQGCGKPRLTKKVINGKTRYFGSSDVARWIKQTFKLKKCTPQMVDHAVRRRLKNKLTVAGIVREHFPHIFEQPISPAGKGGG